MDCADHGIAELAQLSNFHFHFPDRRVPKPVCRLLCGTGHIAVVILEKQSAPICIVATSIHIFCICKIHSSLSFKHLLWHQFAVQKFII